MMFGFGYGRKEKLVAITMFIKRGGEVSVSSHCEGNFTKGNFTKKEVLKKVSEWWDSHGTGLNEYGGIQLVIRERD